MSNPVHKDDDSSICFQTTGRLSSGRQIVLLSQIPFFSGLFLLIDEFRDESYNFYYFFISSELKVINIDLLALEYDWVLLLIHIFIANSNNIYNY